MELITNKPYHTLWYSIPIILLLAAFGFTHSFDLQLHDTYFVMSTFHLGIAGSIILAITGLLYWFVKSKVLINWMISVHVVVTIGTIVFLLFIGYNKTLLNFTSQVGVIVIALFLVSQLIFIINLAVSLLRH